MKNTFVQSKIKRLLFILGVIFISTNSCDNADNSTLYEQSESEEIAQLEFIDIEDFNNPETMWIDSNKELYTQAYNRFMSKVKLKDGLYNYDIVSGDQIGVSDPIFAYIKEHIEFLNGQVMKGDGVLLQENNEILYAVMNKKRPKGSMLTAQEGQPIQRHPLAITGTIGDIGGQAGAALYNFSSAGQAGNFGSYFSYNSSHFSRIGSTTFAGVPVVVHVASSTSVYSQTNPNNSFVSFRETSSGSYTYFDIRNNQGNTLISIRTSNGSDAQDVRDAINCGCGF